jgi:dipeptidyl aminopeptidase/acylaminoacyl peptidase
MVLFSSLLVAGCTGGKAPSGETTPRPQAVVPTATPIPFNTSAPAERATPTSPVTRPPVTTPTATPTLVPSATARVSVFGVVTPLKLRVHRAPGIASGVVGYLEGGDVVGVLGRDSSGGWLYVASQDGGKGWVSAAYVDVLGEISTVPVTAESAASLPAPTKRSVELRGRIFYTSGWGIYSLDLKTGEVRFVTSGSEPAISPSGRWLAFIRDGGEKGLWVKDLSDGSERRIFGGFDVRTPRWSAAEDRIYFSVQDETRQAQHRCIPFINRCWDIPEDKRWHLAEVSFPDGQYTGIPSDLHSFAPNPLKDGKVLYQNERGLARTALDAAPVQVLDKPWLLLPWVRGQGDRVVAQYRLPQGWVVATAGIDGGGFKIVTKSDPLAESKEEFLAPTWSPDGELLAFIRRSNGADVGIVIADEWGHSIREFRPSPPAENLFDGAQSLSWGK